MVLTIIITFGLQLRKIQHFLIVTGFLFCSHYLKAQTVGVFSDFRFNQVTTYQGLSQSSVLSFCQDKYGYIWMGTKDGLNRYDGYKFTIYKNQPGIPNTISNNEIVCIENTSKGDLLIGTRGGGLNKYLYKSNKFIQPSGNNIPSGTVQTIYFENDSTLWVGTLKGLFRGIRSDTNKFGYRFENILKNSIYYNTKGNLIPHIKPHISFVSIIKVGINEFLVGTEEGVFHFLPQNAVFKKLDVDGINKSKITSIIQRNQNEYIIGSGDGIVLTRWDGLKLTPLQAYTTDQLKASARLKNNWINSIISGPSGEVWGGSRGGGFFNIDSLNHISSFHTANTSKNTISDHVINALFIDKTGVLWLGTESQGAYQLDLNRKKFYHFQSNPIYGKVLSSVLITALSGDKNNQIYVGTAYNGISNVSINDNGTYKLNRINANSILGTDNTEIIALLYDSKKTLWVGSANNFITKKEQNERPVNYVTDGFVYTIYEDSEGDIWYGTWGEGFGRISQDNFEQTRFNKTSDNYQSLSSDIVLSLFEDKNGNLWIGTKGGGINISPIRFLKQNIGSFASYSFTGKDENSLSHNDVYCIFQDSKGDIWVGTGNGLNKVSFPKGVENSEAIMQGKIKFEHFTADNGLPNNVIYGILEDNEENVWISTVNGLAKMNLNNYDITNYGVNDGLINNEFHSNASYKDKNGNMYFGGIHGISFFNPAAIKPNPFNAAVAITGLKVNNKNVEPNMVVSDKVLLEKSISTTREITLLPRHKDFSIEFSAMHFSNIENVRYRYRLLGFNDEWRNTGKDEHTASYTNIHEGNYTFQVQATNNDGKWSDRTAELKIEIKPPYWRSPVSFLVYALFMFVLLFFFRKYSIIGAKEKSRLKLRAFEQKKTIELTEAKTRFFTNISHEIRSPLTLIYSPLQNLIKEEKVSDAGQNNLKVIKKNVDRLLNLTNQLIQLRKIDIGLVDPQYERIKLSVFLKDILEFFDRVIETKNIDLSFTNRVSPDTDEVFFDKEMITTTLYNLISNAIKYTPEGGEIRIKVFESTATPSRKALSKKKRGAQSEQKLINIEITDNGIGIPANDLPNVFKRFYQAKTNQAEQPGSGIGLSIVKEYLNLHKGEITVKNMPNKGTSFLIQLPKITAYQVNPDMAKSKSVKDILQKDEEENTPKPSEGNSNKQVDKSDTRPVVLIADDDKEICEYLLNNLKTIYQVIAVHNGNDAWKFAQKHKPNLIISDIMMPGLSGTELCTRLKNEPTLSHIPIILLSGHAANEDIIDGYKHGADRYISKPFSIDLLQVQINQLLNTRQELIELYSRKVLLKPRDFTITPNDEKFLDKIMNLIEENMANPEFDIATIVEKMNMSHSSVLKKTKELTGVPLVEFLRKYRLNKAAMIFEKDKLTISEVAYMTGFSDPKYFSRCFTKQFGMTPTKYLDQLYKS